jgi:hypothetical protein
MSSPDLDWNVKNFVLHELNDKNEKEMGEAMKLLALAKKNKDNKSLEELGQRSFMAQMWDLSPDGTNQRLFLRRFLFTSLFTS